MNARRILMAVGAVVFALVIYQLLTQRGREDERLKRATDSLNVRIADYQADSAERQRSIDSIVRLADRAEASAIISGKRADRFLAQRDSLVNEIRSDTGDVPREKFNETVRLSDSTIKHQAVQIDSLKSSNTSLRAGFALADSARKRADRLLADAEANRDEWRGEAKRANRIGLTVSAAWTVPSGQIQAAIGIGKRIRLPRFLGG